MKLTFKKFVFLGLFLLTAFVFAGCEGVTTLAPTTAAPTTAAPTTVAPTVAPTTVAPTTVAPTVAPTTVAPTTVAPTTAMSDVDFVQAYLNALNLGDLSGLTESLTLPGGAMGISLAWSSVDPDVIDMFGDITIPRYGEGNGTTTLRATASYNSVILHRDFTVTVLEESATTFLTRIGNQILISSADSIIASFTLPGLVSGATLEWESSHPLIAAVSDEMNASNFYTVSITRPAIDQGGEDTSVTLTATISIDDYEIEVEKLIRVIAVETAIVVQTIADVRATAVKGDIVLIEGVLTVLGGTQFFIQDETGGIYVYFMPTDKYDISSMKLGDKLRLLAKIDVFSKSVQINPVQEVTFISEGNPLPDPVVYDDVSFEELLNVQGQLVSIDGLAIKTLSVPAAAGTSFGFILTNGVNDIEVRIDRYTANYDAIKAHLNTLVVGDAVSIVAMGAGRYNDSPQLMMMNPSQIVKVGNAEKLALDLDALTIETEVASGVSKTLPLLGTFGSTIAWDIATSIPAATYNPLTGVIIYPEVTVSTEYTVTATLSISGEEDEEKVFTVTVLPMSDQDKLDADIAQVDVPTVAAEFDEWTNLPVLGTNGTVIVWSVVSGDAVLEAGKLTFSYKGEAYQVVLKAEFTLTPSVGDPLTDEEEYTIDVSAVTVVTDLLTLAQKTGSAWTIAGGASIYVKGVVTGAYVTYGTFIQDENGNGLYCNGLKNQTIGDEVIVRGVLGDYNGARQISSGVLALKLSSDNDIIKTDMTLAQLQAILFAEAHEKASMVVSLEAGLRIKEFRGNYVDFYWYLDGSTQYTLSVYYKDAVLGWMDKVYVAEDTIPAIEFTFYNFYIAGNAFNLANLVLEMPADAAVGLDADALPATLTLNGNYVLPDATYGSTYTVTAITGDVSEFIDYTTTPGTLIVTPHETEDKAGSITITVSKAGAEDEVVVIPVTVLNLSTPDLIGLMIYEVYGGGGNSGCIFSNDYVVIYNPNDVAVSLVGYSLQYASATGVFQTSNNQTLDLIGSIGPESFYLVQLAAGTDKTKPLPVVADHEGLTNMAGTNGKIALVNGPADTPISGIDDPALVDLVAFGTGVPFEGSAAVPGLTNSTAAQRKNLVDTDDNYNDFQIITPSLEYLIPAPEPTYVIDFGTVKDNGYDDGSITFVNTFDSVEYTLVTKRAQSNTSTYAPHDVMGVFAVFAPVNVAGKEQSYMVFDFSDATDPVTKIEFSICAWSGTALGNINNVEKMVNPSFVLQVYEESSETWITLETDDEDTNLISLILSDQYVTVSYTITSGSIFRVFYDFDSATETSNTAYALTLDDFTVYTD
ncbi:MAG: hypothetical protein PHO96_01085 [Candidatus Izemoplasmatales bacterium]|nr:hypothetical protein [Candidatus Izemoplasmatales bacterium]